MPLRGRGAATERRRRRDDRPAGRPTGWRGRDRVGAERDAEEFSGSEGHRRRQCGVSVAALAASKLRDRRGRGGRRPGRAAAPRGVVLARAVRPERPERRRATTPDRRMTWTAPDWGTQLDSRSRRPHRHSDTGPGDAALRAVRRDDRRFGLRRHRARVQVRARVPAPGVRLTRRRHPAVALEF